MSKFYIFVLFLASVRTDNLSGRCPQLKAVDHFDVQTFTGKWFQNAKYHPGIEQNGQCASIEYTKEGSILEAKTTHVVNGIQEHIYGTVTLNEMKKQSGTLEFTFSAGGQVKKFPMFVVAYDGCSYAVVFMCKYDNKNNTHEEFSWVLSRTQQLGYSAKSEVENFFNLHSKVLNYSAFIQTNYTEDACKFSSSEYI